MCGYGRGFGGRGMEGIEYAAETRCSRLKSARRALQGLT